jgi:hypothetical protein
VGQRDISFDPAQLCIIQTAVLGPKEVAISCCRTIDASLKPFQKSLVFFGFVLLGEVV